MEAAFAARDRRWDGRFVVAVRTTGIYCRPSCPARRPRPENTRFYATNAEAEAAGFRPCKRCEPDAVARDAAAVELAIALLRDAAEPLTLADLAQETSYSPSHFQRIFKRSTGLSPAEYARALRRERANESLSGGETVTGAIYEAGYGAPSRFYEDSKGRMGMAPSAWKNGGRGVTISWAVVETTLGPMLVAATEKGVCRLSFGETGEDLRARFPEAELAEGGAGFAQLLEAVIAEVERPGSGGADVPLDVQGTAFQEKVWRELRRIPPGETRSYAEIAAAAGNPRAVRATGSANGANHVSVLIPCHRVVRSDGSLGGYAWGLDIKRELLEREKGRG